MGIYDTTAFHSAVIAETLLIDVARRIQLPVWKHDKAETAYHALCEYIDREASPLHGVVGICYPSGSFGIGAVVASRVRTNQHDLDVVVELAVAPSTPPATVLQLLFQAIRGDPGSRYFDKATLNSRCVTVEYDDGFKVDLMPIVRDASPHERRGYLFHSKDDESYIKPVNPFGFKTLYNDTVQTDPSFVKAFRDGRFEVLVEKAHVEPMDQPARLEEKSPRTVALQLIKRFRDLRHRRADRRGQRCVPSVVLAAYALEKPEPQSSLLWEVLDQAAFIRSRLETAIAGGSLVDVRNPSWLEDQFTDRWPADSREQRNLSNDLCELITKLEVLARNPFSPDTAKVILEELFGETAADYAINEELSRMNRAVDTGAARFTERGAIVTGVAVGAAATRAPARRSTDFGGDEP